MKKYLKIILFCVVAIFAVLILRLDREKGVSRPHLATKTFNTNVAIQQNAIKQAVVGQVMSANTNKPAMPTNFPTWRTNPSAAEEKLHAAVESENVLINFWGLVEDQDGNPLEGVKVSGDTRTWYLTGAFGVDSRFLEYKTASDSNGRFEIRNASGDVLTIKSLEKKGYEPEPHALRGFGFHTSEQFSSDPNNPTLFRMWKTNIHEHLISAEKTFDIVPDGRPYSINLTDATISESGAGDLKVWIQYTNQVVQGQIYDWSAGIDVVNGGLLEETDAYSSMQLAPVARYVPSFQLQRRIKGGQNGEIGDRRFYVLLRNGQEYGRVNINLYAPYGYLAPGLVRLSYTINPTGSRILR
jgi:hypothetical protein